MQRPPSPQITCLVAQDTQLATAVVPAGASYVTFGPMIAVVLEHKHILSVVNQDRLTATYSVMVSVPSPSQSLPSTHLDNCSLGCLDIELKPSRCSGTSSTTSHS